MSLEITEEPRWRTMGMALLHHHMKKGSGPAVVSAPGALADLGYNRELMPTGSPVPVHHLSSDPFMAQW
jgi:hypothetical protein